MAEWIKLGASGLTYDLGDSEFGGMTVTEDGDASFSGFAESMSEYLWRVTGISGFTDLLSVRVVCIHTAGTFSGTADVQYGNPVYTNAIPQWASGADDFTAEFVLEEGETFRLNVSGDFTGFSAVFEMYAFLDGDAPPGPGPGGCFWTDLVNTEQFCGDAPPPEPTYAFESSSHLLDGGGGGLLVADGWLEDSPNLIDAAITAEGYAKITAVYDLDMNVLYSGISDITLAYDTYWVTGLKIFSWGAYDLTYGQTYIIDADFYDAGDILLGSATGTMLVIAGV